MKSPVGTVNTYRIDETIDIGGEGGCLLRGDASLVRTRKGVLVTACFHAQVPQVCSRCLAEFDTPLSVEVQEEFLPGPVADVAPGLGEEAFTITPNQEVDLGAAVRQYVLLALPLKPLCHPQCAGLCPRCGGNLNLGQCTCPSPQPA